MKKRNKKNETMSIELYKIIAIILVIIALIKFGNLFIKGAKDNFENKDIIEYGGRIINRMMDTSNFHSETSKDGISVPVPNGYVASSVESENSVSTGFVIYEGTEPVTDENVSIAKKTRNQWVWVPIADVSDMYWTSTNKRSYNKIFAANYSVNTEGTELVRKTSSNEPNIYGAKESEGIYLSLYKNGMSREQFITELEQDFCEMIDSVGTYGGFYIGRYETGNISQEKPVIQQMNTDISSQNWYENYKKCQKLRGENTSIVTSMAWSIQFDETLKWLIDSGNKTFEEVAKDSTSWGNYPNSTFEWQTIEGVTKIKNSGDKIKIPTGSTEHTKANNIYDLAGNYEEACKRSTSLSGVDLKFSNGGITTRGAAYDEETNVYALIRYFDYSHQRKASVGCRATMYIK